MACDEISKLVDAAPEFLVLGFDMEWPFNIQTGSGKTAVIQISPNLETCYVLQVSKLRNLPKALSELLAHPKTRITGINIKNDIKKLSRDFTGFDTAKIINNCIDSGVLANTILPFQNRWSMEKLITYLLNVKIDKNKKVRMSKWHVSPLSEEQLKYAATDSYASLLLYLELKNREKQMDTNT
ncbi:Werner Syndrome-like exonuclease [Asbolus verrucosus]|uniref:3'-5' exonuclease n=1 Tax=Asbolus verrucosus TaxID=1661398 RepID=A0A482W8A6_ASBVE|nr:Werner Syndrome-like exonuclease [Asbolus verrucosus]